MSLHARLTEDIRTGPSGPKVAALFDLDQTLLAGFSATAFFRERLFSGRMGPRDIAESLLGTLSFAVGRTGFSGFMSATTAAYRGLAEAVLEEVGEEVFEKHLATADLSQRPGRIVQAHQRDGPHDGAIISSATPYQVEPVARDHGDRACALHASRGGGRHLHRAGSCKPTCYGEGKARRGPQPRRGATIWSSRRATSTPTATRTCPCWRCRRASRGP